MSPEQKTLAIAIGKRETAREQLRKYKHSVHLLADAEQLAEKAEAAAQLNLNQLTQEKIKTGMDNTANARAVYAQAMLDHQVATTEHEAGEQLVLQAEHELEQLTKQAHRAAVEVAKAMAAAQEPGLVEAARKFGVAVSRYKSLIKFARVASANAGHIADPIGDLVGASPLKLQLSELTDPKVIDDSFTVTETSLVDAKLGGQS